jgi:putative ATP-dependent endonuclease of OLD family
VLKGCGRALCNVDVRPCGTRHTAGFRKERLDFALWSGNNSRQYTAAIGLQRSDAMKLVGIGITNFRSIGAEPVFVSLEKKVNVLIGANNSGKSNVIKALLWLAEHGPRRPMRVGHLDQHMLAGTARTGYVFDVAVEADDKMGHAVGDRVQFVTHIKDETYSCTATPFDGMRWQDFVEVQEQYLGRRFRVDPGNETLQAEKIKAAERIIHEVAGRIPQTFLVPQFRQIREGEYGLDGAGIISTLASWQRPGIGKHGDMARFHQIEDLLRRLLHAPEIELDVDHEKKHIMVTRNGLRLPLESYGTGIHELIILATALYSQENVLFCIEEPEIHLHPRLQKELLHFLLTETKNRYVLTTHSPALLAPSDDVQVTHLRSVAGVTKAWGVEATENALQVLDDLGVRASDILQANFVIWVEGPSDRIYINQWLKLLKPDLREGIEYSIMFYGGRLLSHLSLVRGDGFKESFPEPEQLIPLLKLNQRAAVVIDSDYSKKASTLNVSKAMVQEECKKSDACCWVTHGREIENYLSPRAVACAYKAKTGEEPVNLKLGRYDRMEVALKRAYDSKWKSSYSYDAAKPDWARLISEQTTAEDLGQQLRDALEPIIAAIGQANS